MLTARNPNEAPDADHWIDPQAERNRDLLKGAFAGLERSAPEEKGMLRFHLPGCTLEVRYVGRQVASALTVAFAHLAQGEPEESALQLSWRIGDASLAGGFPQLPEPPRPLHPLGSLHRNEANDVLVERRQGFATVLDASGLQLTTIVDGLAGIDTDLAAKPLLRFLLPLLLKQGVVMCHAALVGGRDKGLLVTGQGGVGKSTISAACLSAGTGFCSDDFVALQWTGDRLIGHCLYASLMLTEAQMPRFPRLAAHAVQYRADTFGKYLVPLAPHFPGQLRPSLEVDAVAVPEIVADAPSQLVPGKRSAMLRAITPSTLIASPWREADRTRFLFERIPLLEPLVYRSGSEFGRIADPVRMRYDQ